MTERFAHIYVKPALPSGKKFRGQVQLQTNGYFATIKTRARYDTPEEAKEAAEKLAQGWEGKEVPNIEL